MKHNLIYFLMAVFQNRDESMRSESQTGFILLSAVYTPAHLHADSESQDCMAA